MASVGSYSHSCSLRKSVASFLSPKTDFKSSARDLLLDSSSAIDASDKPSRFALIRYSPGEINTDEFTKLYIKKLSLITPLE